MKPYMQERLCRRFVTAGLVVAASFPALLRSQTPAAAEPPIVLTPFQVNAEEDVGYMGQSTLAGSRLNTSLKDTAAPISIFTDELMSDIGITNFDELATWGVNTQIDYNADAVNQNNMLFSPGANPTVRGLRAARARNYYQWVLSQDVYNVERAELSSGPNAVLFGLGAPGGIFNASTKRAQANRSFYRFESKVGSHNYLRNHLDINQLLVKDRLALRVNLLKMESESWRDWEWNDSERAHVALTWKVTANSTFRAEWEDGKVSMNTPRTFSTFLSHHAWTEAHAAALAAAGGNEAAIPEGSAGGFFRPYRGASTYFRYTGAALPATVTQQSGVYPVYLTQSGILYDAAGEMRVQLPTPRTAVYDDPYVPNHVWVKGPHDTRSQDGNTHSFSYEAKLADNVFFEAGYNKQRNYYDYYGTDLNLGLQVDLNLTLPDGTPNPNVGRYYLDSIAQQRVALDDRETYRAMLSYEYDARKKSPWLGWHRFAAMYENAEVYQATDVRSLTVSNNSLPGFSATNASAAANRINFRTYVDIADPASMVWDGYTVFVDQPFVWSTPRTSTPTLVGQKTSAEWTGSANETRQFFDDMDSEMFVMQNFWWNGRFITAYGARRDSLNRNSIIALPQTDATGRLVFGPGAPEYYRNISRSYSALLHLTKNKNLSVFYNTGTNFQTPNPTHLVVGLVSPPVGKGDSQDYGIKFDLFDGKLSGSILRYETVGKNLTENAAGGTQVNAAFDALVELGLPAPDGSPLTVNNVANWKIGHNAVVYDNESEGYELSLVANPTRNLRLFFNYSYNETRGSSAGDEIVAYYDFLIPYLDSLRGQRVDASGIDRVESQINAIYNNLFTQQFNRNGEYIRGFSKEKANLRANYTWTESALKGLSLGGGVQWVSAPVIGKYREGGRQAGETPRWSELQPFDNGSQTPIYGEAQIYTHLNVGYRTKLKLFGRATDISFQLNVNNVFDNTDPVITQADYIPTREDPILPRTYRFVTPREFFLTTQIRF